MAAPEYTSSHPYATEGNLLLVMHEARYAGGLAASGQRAAFGGNLFTRDACRVALDMMEHTPSTVRELLGILPQMQGIEENPVTNEFPDAMPHQVFRQIVGGRHLPDQQVANAEYWTNKWGVPMSYNKVDGKWFTIYNSSDAPLLYLITLAEYCRLPNGREVLSDTFTHRPTGETRTVGEAGVRCLNAVMNSLKLAEEKGLPFYAVPNTNPKQTSPSGAMRDGFDSYYYPEGPEPGKPVDFSLMAYIDNQALAYEALTRAATELFPHHKDAETWLKKAEDIRRESLRAFWMQDVRFFAAAIDKDGKPVQLESSAAAELLNGPFLSNLPDGPDIVRAIARWVYSDGVMTPIGPRMVHRKFGSYEGDYYSYAGTGAVWPHVNGIIAKGLRKHGLYTPSRDLGIERTLGLFNRAGEAVEMSFVERETNEPAYYPYPVETPITGARPILAAEIGQLDQAWAASAGLREIWDAHNNYTERPGTWQWEFCRELMRLARLVPPASAGQPEALLYVDLKAGKALKEERAKALGLAS